MPQSKEQYRAIKNKHGQVSAGQHVCHIVAAAMGGADHPDNFVMGDGGLNTSFGMYNDDLTAALVGLERARTAVAASVAHGAAAGQPYAGPTAEQLYWSGRARLLAALSLFEDGWQAGQTTMQLKPELSNAVMWKTMKDVLDAIAAAQGGLRGRGRGGSKWERGACCKGTRLPDAALPTPLLPSRHRTAGGGGKSPAPAAVEHLWPALAGPGATWLKLAAAIAHSAAIGEPHSGPRDPKQVYFTALAFVGAARHMFGDGFSAARILLLHARAAGNPKLEATAKRLLRSLCEAHGAPWWRVGGQVERRW